MILRLWRGWTDDEHADAYDRILDTDVAPGIVGRELSGLRSFDAWRRVPSEVSGRQEFLTVMCFDDMEAVVRFAGDVTSSYVPPQARAVLAGFDRHSQHYELRRRHLRG